MPLVEKGVRGKGRPLSPPQHTEARSATSAPLSERNSGQANRPDLREGLARSDPEPVAGKSELGAFRFSPTIERFYFSVTGANWPGPVQPS
jgi:hypothetical protein